MLSEGTQTHSSQTQATQMRRELVARLCVVVPMCARWGRTWQAFSIKSYLIRRKQTKGPATPPPPCMTRRVRVVFRHSLCCSAKSSEDRCVYIILERVTTNINSRPFTCFTIWPRLLWLVRSPQPRPHVTNALRGDIAELLPSLVMNKTVTTHINCVYSRRDAWSQLRRKCTFKVTNKIDYSIYVQ